IFPGSMPNSNHNRYNGRNTCEKKNEKNRNVAGTSKAHHRTPTPLSNGYNPTARKTQQKTRPKERFDPGSIFVCAWLSEAIWKRPPRTCFGVNASRQVPPSQEDCAARPQVTIWI